MIYEADSKFILARRLPEVERGFAECQHLLVTGHLHRGDLKQGSGVISLFILEFQADLKN